MAARARGWNFFRRGSHVAVASVAKLGKTVCPLEYGASDGKLTYQHIVFSTVDRFSERKI